MITQKERDSIRNGFDNIQKGLSQILSMCNLYESKIQIINKLISNRFSNEIQNFEVKSKTYVSSKNMIIELTNDYASIPPIEDNITEHYKMFLFSEIVSFNPEQMTLLQPIVVRNIFEFVNKQNDAATNITPNDNKTFTFLRDIPDSYLQYIKTLSEKFSRLYIFNQLKSIQGNIVMIGANGSGKSTFARQLNGKLANNIVILSAQHLLFYVKNQNISATGTEIQEVRNFQLNSKLGNDSNLSSLLSSDMNKLVNALVSEHADCAHNYYENNSKKISYLSRTIELWKSIIEHRELKNDRTGIFVQGENIDPYLFNLLSDGEKSVFYYIGHILLALENSYIIVDEPENHLHLAICNRLWDCLEQERPDCKFIYLTHNLDFATSRTDSTILWNKSFIPPSQWNFEILPSSETIPEVLVMELVGSRKNICFCEGDTKSSLDYRLYSILFPNYTIIPVSGHRNVIEYTNTYNTTTSFTTNAVGIIDGDYHLKEQIDKWREKKVFTLPINEIENILCDDFVLSRAIECFCAPTDTLEIFHDEFWKLINENKTLLATSYVNNYINALFKDNFLHEKNDIQALIEELAQITSPEKANCIYNGILEKLESFLTSKNYNDAIRFVNFKGRLTRDIAQKTIVNKYENRILDLIKKSTELQEYILKTYFSEFNF